MLARSKLVAVQILRRERKASSQDVFGLKTRGDPQQCPKALGHQTGSDQEDKSDSDLPDYENTPQAGLASGHTTATLFQGIVCVYLPRLKQGKQAEKNSCEEGDQAGEGEHATINRDLGCARQIWRQIMHGRGDDETCQRQS